MRRHRLLQVLKRCICEHMYLEAAAAALAYIFGLRVPSELLMQAHSSIFRLRGSSKILYGPIRRKGKQQLCTLCRFCTCATVPLLCAHAWVAILAELVPHGRCFPFTAKRLMARLWPFIASSGEAAIDERQWTSHCFRRGSGVDVL